MMVQFEKKPHKDRYYKEEKEILKHKLIFLENETTPQIPNDSD